MQQEINVPEQLREVVLSKEHGDIGDWVEDNRRIFSNLFRFGFNKTYVQMIRLHRSEQYEVRYIG